MVTHPVPLLRILPLYGSKTVCVARSGGGSALALLSPKSKSLHFRPQVSPRLGPSSFHLGPIGTYQILFEVSVTEAGQLILTLNGQDLDYTVAGRATGASQIVGMAVVTTTAVNSILTVRNPASNAAALTITPLAGGTRPVSAHLVITQIS